MNILKLIALALCIGITPLALASGHEEETPSVDEAMGMDTAEKEVGYYELKPDITTNLSTTPKSKRLHYVRIKLAIMVSDETQIPKIEEKEALIRDIIVSAIGSKDYMAAKASNFREQIREEIRSRISMALFDKEKDTIIEDVLILNYMYQ